MNTLNTLSQILGLVKDEPQLRQLAELTTAKIAELKEMHRNEPKDTQPRLTRAVARNLIDFAMTQARSKTIKLSLPNCTAYEKQQLRHYYQHPGQYLLDHDVMDFDNFCYKVVSNHKELFRQVYRDLKATVVVSKRSAK